MKPTVFAIDFGTSNTLLAAAAPGVTFPPAALDPLAADPTVLRTALYFPSADKGFYGAAALHEFVANGFRGRLIRSIKRHLPSPSFTKTLIGSRMVGLDDLVGAFLRHVRKTACAQYGVSEDLARVVLGRPARFSNDDAEDALAEQRLESAARKAGFTDVTFCAEPVAAAYDFAEDLTSPRVVLVVDLGGGTSDFTVVRMDAKGFGRDDILAVGGVAVAGDAIDGALVRRAVAPEFGSRAHYKAPFGSNTLEMPSALVELLCSPADLTLLDRDKVLRQLKDIRSGLVAPGDRPKLERFSTVVEDGVGFTLYDAVEHAKRRLSDEPATRIALDYPGAEFDVEATRATLEEASERTLERITKSLDDTLAAAGVGPGDIEVVCLTGGTSRMPLVEAAFRAKLPGASFRRLKSFHSVVQGLARRAREVAEA